MASRQDLGGIYASSSLLCLPALFEPYGLAVQEAMAAGVVPIVSSVGELPFIVDYGRAGRIIPPGEPERLADVIVELLSRSATTDCLRRAAVGRAEELSWTVVVARIIETLLAAEGPGEE